MSYREEFDIATSIFVLQFMETIDELEKVCCLKLANVGLDNKKCLECTKAEWRIHRFRSTRASRYSVFRRIGEEIWYDAYYQYSTMI